MNAPRGRRDASSYGQLEAERGLESIDLRFLERVDTTWAVEVEGTRAAREDGPVGWRFSGWILRAG
jgi:hypothetical protein